MTTSSACTSPSVHLISFSPPLVIVSLSLLWYLAISWRRAWLSRSAVQQQEAEWFQTGLFLQKSCGADTCSLEGLACSTAAMRRTELCAHLRGVSHVGKEPPCEGDALPGWMPSARSPPGWQTGALCRAPTWKKQHNKTWLNSKRNVLLWEVKLPLKPSTHILLIPQVHFPKLISSSMALKFAHDYDEVN